MKLEVSKSIHDNKIEAAKMKAGEICRIRVRLQAYEVLKLYTE